MKKSLLALLLIAGLSAYAQPDIAVTLVSPPDMGSFSAGVAFNYDVKIDNLGTVAIDASDSIVHLPLINGSVIGTSGGGFVYYIETGNSIAANGGSQTFSHSLTLSGGASGTLSFCGFGFVLGNGWSGVTESDTVNNEDCNSVTYSTGSVGTSEFKVVTRLDNSYFSNGVYYVNLENFAISQQPVIRVFNITGKEVFTSGLNFTSNSVIDNVTLPQLGKGVYVVQITSEGKAISTKKIMIQ